MISKKIIIMALIALGLILAGCTQTPSEGKASGDARATYYSDLVIGGITNPTNPTDAAPFKVPVIIKNQGDSSSSKTDLKLVSGGDCQTTYAVGTEDEGEVEFGAINKGSSTTIQYEIVCATPGSKNLTFNVDFSGNVAENTGTVGKNGEYAGENNNIKTRAITVAGPDLMVSSAAPATTPAKASVPFNLKVTVKNAGKTASTLETNVKAVSIGTGGDCSIAEDSPKELTVPILSKGATTTVTFNNITCTAGKKSVKLVLDDPSNVAEQNENNNKYNGSITVKAS